MQAGQARSEKAGARPTEQCLASPLMSPLCPVAPPPAASVPIPRTLSLYNPLSRAWHFQRLVRVSHPRMRHANVHGLAQPPAGAPPSASLVQPLSAGLPPQKAMYEAVLIRYGLCTRYVPCESMSWAGRVTRRCCSLRGSSSRTGARARPRDLGQSKRDIRQPTRIPTPFRRK